jgi:3',5'-cyclic AMP phosphodiesterase CpdA
VEQVRIVHVSDIHFWQYEFNPLRLLSKRLVGMASLVAGRARRFRLEGVPRLVERVLGLKPDHILITGDLTTTALPGEFKAARAALARWLDDPNRVTIVPGNHDRYTLWAHRTRRFERYFAAYAPRHSYPWLRRIDPVTAILGLDPTRSGISARGKLPRDQLREAERLVADAGGLLKRLLIACHYPVWTPSGFARELARKSLINAGQVGAWLGTIGPHVYCCGHIHATWAFRPAEIPGQLCINPGAPLLWGHAGRDPPGFLEVVLDGPGVMVNHHCWVGDAWDIRQIHRDDAFFAGRSGREVGP